MFQILTFLLNIRDCVSFMDPSVVPESFSRIVNPSESNRGRQIVNHHSGLTFAPNGFLTIWTCHHLIWAGDHVVRAIEEVKATMGRRGHVWFPARQTTPELSKRSVLNGGTPKWFNLRCSSNANPQCANETRLGTDVLLGNSSLVLTTSAPPCSQNLL